MEFWHFPFFCWDPISAQQLFVCQRSQRENNAYRFLAKLPSRLMNYDAIGIFITYPVGRTRLKHVYFEWILDLGTPFTPGKKSQKMNSFLQMWEDDICQYIFVSLFPSKAAISNFYTRFFSHHKSGVKNVTVTHTWSHFQKRIYKIDDSLALPNTSRETEKQK